ncbi:30116_t:CDS:2, partial [Racocetra persica]
YSQQGGYQSLPPGGQYPPPGGYGYGGEYSQQGGYQSLPPGGQYSPPGGYGYGGNNDPYGQQQQETKNVEEIKSQIRDTKMDSLASTQRSLQMVNDAEVFLLNTERINHTARQMDLSEAHTERANKHAGKLKKVNGSMFGFEIDNPFTKKKREAAELARVQAMHKQERDSRMHTRTGNYESQKRINEALKQSDIPSSYGRKSPSSNRSNFQFEPDEADDHIENQLDNNLDMLSQGLTQLKDEATTAREEVRNQNEVLDHISHTAGELDNRVVGTTHRLRKI